jgi:hypothetical protein
MDILKFVSETEFAAECKVSVETIRRATKRGDLPYVRLSDRKRLIPENALGIMLAEVLERRYAEKNSGHMDAIDVPTLPNTESIYDENRDLNSRNMFDSR